MVRRITKQIFAVAALLFFCFNSVTEAQDALPSWNDGPAKQAIIEFVRTDNDAGSS